MNAPLRQQLFSAYGGLAEEILRGYCFRPVTLRFNTLKITAEEGKRMLSYLCFSFRECGFPEAIILDGKDETRLRETSLYQRGEIYLQSLSSMLPPIYLGAKAGEDVLDMTAAPGGKTAQICALSDGKALVTACEKDKARFERMRFNLERQGARANLLHADALTLDEMFSFDKVLLDAPCSGSGTIEEEDGARVEEGFVERCAVRQEKLLKKAYRLLKRGGTLVYSTCSVLPRENGEVLQNALKSLPHRIEPILPPNGASLLPSPEGTICICPNELFEGFFIAKIVKE